jgi:hypothetical protein
MLLFATVPNELAPEMVAEYGAPVCPEKLGESV